MSDLPQPNEAFEWVQAAAGPALVCRSLAAAAPHVFTTRQWPPGSAIGAADPDQGWTSVAAALDVSPRKFARLRQVHGCRVVSATEAIDAHVEGDILVCGDPEVAIAVQAADCVPLLIADSRTGAVAAAHAGWRGLAERVPRKTVAALTAGFGSRPGDLVAAIGPAIGACCYEVGAIVRDRFEREGFSAGEVGRWFGAAPAIVPGNPPMRGVASGGRPDHWFFDAARAAREQLQAAGMPPAQIFSAGLCTASHPDVLCSFRRDGSAAGRIVAAIRSRPRP